MADPGKDSEVDRLLAEVDSALGGKPDRAVVPATGGGPARPTRRARLRQRASTAAVAGAVAAGGVWLLFAFLPFLGAIDGAAGAFIGVFAYALLIRRR
jgi:ferric-dicitrate binding protein FerR (iron transport regulator)